jgi:hypothetical protein
MSVPNGSSTPDPIMSLEANNPTGVADAASGSTPRFAYPSGSRPLEGYTIKRGIGRGGFGEVYYAVSDAGKEVALKLIRRNLDIELRGVTQCLNLKHVNLLSLFDIKRDALDDSWVVMEYVSGESLEDVIERSPQGMRLADLQHWLSGIFAAVDYLHAHGIVHRDLKPGNIFSDNHVVKIGDYGLSKFISCSRRSGHTESIGTIHYMAPEIANGRYGKEIDVYALGVIVYEMVTGHVPFEGESLGEVLMKHLTAEPDVTRLAEPYRSAVRRALEKDPAKRWNTVADFAAALQIPLGAPSAAAAATAQPAGTNPAANPATEQTATPAGTAASFGVDERLGAPGVASRRRTFEQAVSENLKQTGGEIQAAWGEANFGAPILLVSVLACVVLFGNAPRWIGAGLLGSLLYMGIGFAVALVRVRRRVLRPRSEAVRGLDRAAVDRVPAGRPIFPTLPGKPQPPLRFGKPFPGVGLPPPPAPEGPWRGSWNFARRSDRWKTSAALNLSAKTMHTRLTELTGSMLVAAFVAAVAALVALLLRSEQSEPEQYAWLAIVGTFGAWGIMIPAKFWEGRSVETALRRLLIFVIGLVVGAAAYGVQSLLQVSANFIVLPWDPNSVRGNFARHVLEGPYFSPEGIPSLLACMAYFGFLFLVPRWWLQADPLRRKRVSVWSVAAVVAWAFILTNFWSFPSPWGLFIAGIIGLSVQLSSVWISPRRAA